ncbi:MAG: radical SAM family heme chaperone HemW [Dehalococcoidia bacterium]|nr:radical SAM family heme chaperone HemW [Dehalococcoidia bacterium]
MSTDALSLYLHIPFCRCRCAYCSFVSYTGRDGDLPRYAAALERELRIRKIDGALVSTIYFGGGTPSLLPPDAVHRLLAAIDENFLLDDRVEITMEVNPGTVSAEYLRELRKTGVNRLSLGVQSFDSEELALLGRIHTADEARQAVAMARQSGFQNLSLDFIYGLPNRRPDTWRRMLDEAIATGAPHLSLYGLTIEEGTPLAATVERGELPTPDSDAAASEYELADEMLEQAGFRHYELSNWSKPGFESRHNMVYWKRGRYLGMGVAAHSFINGQRLSNTSSLDEYLAATEENELPPHSIEEISSETALSEAVILGLRLDEGVAADDIKQAFNVDLYGRFREQIAECTALGLLGWDGKRMKLTTRGRLLGNEVFMRFLPLSSTGHQ